MALSGPLQGGEQMNSLDGIHYEQFGLLNTSSGAPETRGFLTGTIARPYLASNLPFDILFLISLEYLTQETPAHPAETLFLVCKSWRQAALSSSRRWSTFRMHSFDFKFWSHCVPRRLDRCSPDILLDIDIEFVASVRRSSYDMSAAYASYNTIMGFLIGPDGQVARRWRRFSARGRGNVPVWFAITRAFDFQTPNLEEIDLEHIRGISSAFPVTPSLKVYSSYNVQMPLPDLRTATEVSVCTDEAFEAATAKSVNLVTLKLFTTLGGQYRLSYAYPRLTHLRLPEGLYKRDLNGFSAPALQELHLDFIRGSEFLCVVACEGVPLGKLKKVSLASGGRIRDLNKEAFLHGLRVFLRAVSQIEVLDLPSVVTQAFVLKLLTTECEDLYQDHDVITSIHGYETKLGRGENRLRIVDKFHRVRIMVPFGPWEKIFEILRWYLPRR